MLLEPLSAGALSFALAKNCFHLSLWINRIRKVDGVVEALGKDIERLKLVLESVDRLVRESNDLATVLQGNRAKKHWESIEILLGECRTILEKLDYIFRSLDKKRDWKVWKEIRKQWNDEDIRLYSHQITECRDGIHFNLLMINVYNLFIYFKN